MAPCRGCWVANPYESDLPFDRINASTIAHFQPPFDPHSRVSALRILCCRSLQVRSCKSFDLSSLPTTTFVNVPGVFMTHPPRASHCLYTTTTYRDVPHKNSSVSTFPSKFSLCRPLLHPTVIGHPNSSGSPSPQQSPCKALTLVFVVTTAMTKW